jgi:hypothetical protein
MKQAAVQSSAAGSAGVNWSLNDSSSMIPAVSDCEPNGESYLSKGASARGIIWPRLLLEGRAESIANSYYCELLIALGDLALPRARSSGEGMCSRYHCLLTSRRPKERFEFLY